MSVESLSGFSHRQPAIPRNLKPLETISNLKCQLKKRSGNKLIFEFVAKAVSHSRQVLTPGMEPHCAANAGKFSKVRFSVFGFRITTLMEKAFIVER